MLIKAIVEDYGKLWAEGIISCKSINIASYQGKRVHVVGGDFYPCVGVSLGREFRESGCFFESFEKNI